jgi:hypothetical protein
MCFIMDFLSVSIHLDFSQPYLSAVIRTIISSIVLEESWNLAARVYLIPSSPSHRPALRAHDCFSVKSTAPAATVRSNRLPIKSRSDTRPRSLQKCTIDMRTHTLFQPLIPRILGQASMSRSTAWSSCAFRYYRTASCVPWT